MSEPQEPKAVVSPLRTILFMVVLSFVCAFILSVLASSLQEHQEIAKDLDRSKQMMIAAKILDHEGHFLLTDERGNEIFAQYESGGRLVPAENPKIASHSELINVLEKRLIPLLVDDRGNLKTFKEAGLNEDQYLTDYKKTGYYKQPFKLLYAILPNPDSEKKAAAPMGYIIPVNGFGLWDAIYGFLALKKDGNTVIGISWYDQKETPGLGANIAEKPWQSLFPGKKIFQESPGGQTEFKTTPLGITVVKGKVVDVFGETAKAKSAVDGMAGATITGKGVTDAYREVLEAYRPFLLKIHDESKS